MTPDILAAAAVLPALILSVAHFFPWGELPGRHGKPLPRLMTYAIGVGTIVGISSLLAWGYAVTALDVLLLLWIVSAAAGVATLLAWLISDSLRAHAEARAAQIAERAARERD